ncbi:MAG: hypothetical protein ACI8RZ_001718 [Myxococcota bacterium]|jgi:hypothetical protein
MAFLDTVVAFFRRPAEDTADEVPEGACPNCWGRLEFDGKVRQAMVDRQISVNNGEAHYAFIQAFVVKNIDGIRLKDSARGPTCSKCGQVHG